jgi:type IV pilus assembly protein PilW
MNHTYTKRHFPGHAAARQSGLTLIEMLVALTIGGLLIFGAAQAYVDSRNAYAVNETISRMQESARYAMSVLEPEIRMSNYWGLMKGAETISGKRRPTDATDFGGAAATRCGNNFALDLENNVQGWDASYGAGCAAFGRATAADSFVIRRAAVTPSVGARAPGALRVCSSRVLGILVTDTTETGCDGAFEVPATSQVNDLIVNYFYVDERSDIPGVPSLRRYFLTPDPDLQEDEIVPGVEDMQVQYGVDRFGGLGPRSGAATQYLDAGPALTALLTDASNPAQIVSVRIWLLVRADTPEVGFVDDRVYEYGSRRAANGFTSDLTNAAEATLAFRPSLSANNTLTGIKRYRRVLVSRTIQIRNALGT